MPSNSEPDCQCDLRFEVDCGEGMRVSLVHYAGDTCHARHSHSFWQASFLLAGRMRERLDAREYELDYPSVGLKPAGAMHEDRWGEEGVLIFSVCLTDELAAPLQRPSFSVWSRVDEPAGIAKLVRCCLLAPTLALRVEAVEDLLASIGGQDETFSREAHRQSRVLRTCLDMRRRL